MARIAISDWALAGVVTKGGHASPGVQANMVNISLTSLLLLLATFHIILEGTTASGSGQSQSAIPAPLWGTKRQEDRSSASSESQQLEHALNPSLGGKRDKRGGRLKTDELSRALDHGCYHSGILMALR